MKKSLLLLIVTIFTLTTAFDANAQWTDRNTFGLKGPVKAVYDAYGTKIYGFSKNGTYQIQSDAGDITRDSYGRMTKVETYSGPYARYWGIEYIYDDEGRLSKTIDSDGNSEEFTYNSKGLVSSSTSDYNGSCSYTYTKFDNYGNWIKRTIKGSSTYSETRKITYY